MLGTNGISITNNIIYNTYRSGIVVTGMNNIIQNNLVTTVYWLGTGQIPSVAEFNFNNDGAIMTRDVTSVRLLVCINILNIFLLIICVH
jgi:parallel beta-helix repeat protein